MKFSRKKFIFRRYRRKRWNPFKMRDVHFRQFLSLEEMRNILIYSHKVRWSHKPYFPFSGDKELRDEHLRYGLR